MNKGHHGRKSPYPGLLFDAGVVQLCRERAQKQEGVTDGLNASLGRIYAADPDVIDHTNARAYSEKMLAAAEAMILLGRGPSELAWVKRRMKALLAAPTWIVHYARQRVDSSRRGDAS